MAPNKLNGPNFRSKNYVSEDVGKSRTAFWEAEATVPQDHPVHLEYVKANGSFVLPANSGLTGEIVVFNNSATAQAAITIGTASGGTQVSAGASVPALTTQRFTPTDIGISRTARTIFFNSAAWQAGTHIVLYVRDYPPVPDATAVS